MKVALCIGHSRRILGRLDGGAVSVGKVSEHAFNSEIAGALRDALKKQSIESSVFDSYGGRGYTAAMRDIAEQVRKYGADLALELHFNSATPAAEGFEYLHHHKSIGGKRLASLLFLEHARQFPSAKARAVKPLTSNDRGFEFVNLTHCPAVLTEPFFGSNAAEWAAYSTKAGMAKLVKAYADAIIKFPNK